MSLATTQGKKRITRLVPIALAAVAVLSNVASVAAEVTLDNILTDLHRPRGIAVRPGGTADRFDVFIADSGAGRVVRWSNQLAKQAVEAVAGFDAKTAADPNDQTGPVALWFLDPGLLLVGTTQDKDGDLLQAFELQDGEKVLRPDEASEATSKSNRLAGTTCMAITRSRVNEFVPDRLFLAVRGSDGAARLLSARVQAGIVGEPQPFSPSAPAPARAVTISNSGRVVVAEDKGQLVYYNPVDGQVELALKTDLKQPMGLAYNASTGSLYAADFAGGIYRLDDASQPGNPACRTVKVSDLSRPTALTFGPDGSLYVLTFGNTEDNGTLTILSGDL